MLNQETINKIDVVLSTIENYAKEKYGYEFKKSKNINSEYRDLANIIQRVTNVRNSKTDINLIRAILLYKKTSDLLNPVNVSNAEYKAINKIFSDNFIKNYKLADLTELRKDQLISEIKDNEILEFKTNSTYDFDGADYENTEKFSKAITDYIVGIQTKVLGSPTVTRNPDTVSFREKAKLEKIFKYLVKLSVTDVENNGFIVYKKRELLDLISDKFIVDNLKNVKSENDLTNSLVNRLDTYLKGKMSYKSTKFTTSETKIINDCIIKSYNQNVAEYEFNLTGDNIPVDILKSTKKIGDLKAIKTPTNFKDLGHFEREVFKLVSQGTKILFENAKPKDEVRKRNSEEVIQEVRNMIDKVCKFNLTDEIIFKEIAKLISGLKNVKGIDGVEISEKSMTALISYNNGTGLFLVNPYVIVEVYKKRIVEDKTGELYFEDSQRLDKNGTIISKFLSGKVSPLLKKRNKVNILTKGISSVDDAKRLSALINATKSKNPEFVAIFKKMKLKFTMESDDLGKVNRLKITINGNRNIIVNPEFIYDLELNKFYFIRENLNSPIQGIKDSNFKPENVQGVDSETTKFLLALITSTFDLRKSIN